LTIENLEGGFREAALSFFAAVQAWQRPMHEVHIAAREKATALD
jgi:hypothetical protein